LVICPSALDNLDLGSFDKGSAGTCFVCESLFAFFQVAEDILNLNFNPEMAM
jgi:hypothetical protein